MSGGDLTLSGKKTGSKYMNEWKVVERRSKVRSYEQIWGI